MTAIARFSSLSALVGLLLFGSSCRECGGDQPPDQASRVSIAQGAWGQVWFWEGDLMPIGPSRRITAVSRTVYAFELTRTDQVTPAGGGGFYSAIHTRLVDSVRSDGRGFFQLTLPVGRYSFFVREQDAYYANGWDGDSNILPATVETGAVAKVQIDLTYRAFF